MLQKEANNEKEIGHTLPPGRKVSGYFTEQHKENLKEVRKQKN